ncbi:NAD-dependent epimerase/dehydratase family protein [Mucilaginibacter sp. AW1-3]
MAKLDSKLRVIVTGATGMVGEGVLQQCLQHAQVEAVLVINRKPCGVTHPKLKEIIHADFFDISPVANQLSGYNACFFCLGVSSIGMKEPEYYKMTYTLTMHVAQTLSRLNPGMTFCYISGGSTDSTEQGKIMWARVKGKTENDLAKLPFKQEYNFRPGMMKPAKGAKNVLKFYKYLGWMYPLLRALGMATTIAELGLAMINSAIYGYKTRILEIKDIKELAAYHE